MIVIEKYIKMLIEFLGKEFGTRLLYVGLQGSYLRGEATEHSDIDIMVVLDELGFNDLEAYRSVIRSLDHADRSCGFICGKEELANWNPMEIRHLQNCTKDFYGTLRELIPAYTERDVRNYVKMSLNNLYHELCHRYIHAADNRNIADLAFSYKNVFFILQNLYYLNRGKVIKTKAEMLATAEGKDYTVMQRAMELSRGVTHDFDESFILLFGWCKETMCAV